MEKRVMGMAGAAPEYKIDQFADQMQNSQTYYFYPQIAVLTKLLVKIDADVIDELVSLLSIENPYEKLQ